MTTHPIRRPHHADQQPARSDSTAPASGDDAPRVAAAVPIAVWRLDDHSDDPLATGASRGFALRLATRLVQIYTRRGDTVVDLDNDPHLRHAATSAGRHYLAADQVALAELRPVATPVSLIALRWPPTTPDATIHLTDTLAACRHLMSGDTSLVAAVRPLRTGDPDSTFANYANALGAASDAGGLTPLLQIVAVSAPRNGDQFLYHATADEADDIARQATGSALHIDLLIFSIGAPR